MNRPRYFLTREVPGCHNELALLVARDDTGLGMRVAWF
ncbi:3-methylmercaptopropionyl-CoA dehydrogenase (DmdC) [Pseudomonas sp. NGC7]